MCTIIIFCTIVTIISYFHYLYYRLTKFEKEITVIKKYEKNVDNVQTFHILDNNGNGYMIGTCLWKIKWDTDYVWKHIIENQKYRVHGYGRKIEPFGMEPIIYELVD